MADLRRKVASRLREAMHGRTIEDESDVELPHMIGVTPLGEMHEPRNEEGTILDPSYSFWNHYERDVDTLNKAREEIEKAILLLREDGTFTKTYPFDDEDVVYIEVDYVDDSTRQLTCPECGASIAVSVRLSEDTDV